MQSLLVWLELAALGATNGRYYFKCCNSCSVYASVRLGISAKNTYIWNIYLQVDRLFCEYFYFFSFILYIRGIFQLFPVFWILNVHYEDYPNHCYDNNDANRCGIVFHFFRSILQ